MLQEIYVEITAISLFKERRGMTSFAAFNLSITGISIKNELSSIN